MFTLKSPNKIIFSQFDEYKAKLLVRFSQVILNVAFVWVIGATKQPLFLSQDLFLRRNLLLETLQLPNVLMGCPLSHIT